jgi:hypothetical protein
MALNLGRKIVEISNLKDPEVNMDASIVTRG